MCQGVRVPCLPFQPLWRLEKLTLEFLLENKVPTAAPSIKGPHLAAAVLNWGRR